MTDSEKGCTWETGGIYPITPPEHCDEDAEPGEEYCVMHLKRARALEVWEAEAGLADQ